LQGECPFVITRHKCQGNVGRRGRIA
jgi:hypothetical protein